MVANGTIGNPENPERFVGSQWYHWCQWYHRWKLLVTLVSPNGTIGKANGDNQSISYLFLYILIFYAYISVFLLFSNIILLKIVLICEKYKFKVKDAILDRVTFTRWQFCPHCRLSAILATNGLYQWYQWYYKWYHWLNLERYWYTIGTIGRTMNARMVLIPDSQELLCI